MTLGDKQKLFAKLVGKLLTWVYENSIYTVTFGEAYRTSEQAKINAQKGRGIANSLHTQRLAIDLNLFVEGFYQTNSEKYRPLGDFWKSLHPLCRWGGDFKKPDGNHFSLEHDGVK